MSIQSRPYYWLTCDRCGRSSTEGSDYAAWSSVEGALADAGDVGWIYVGVKHYCEGCTEWDEESDQLVPKQEPS